jgi:(p)ppGpp synthase/HD superfamily hydrolase
MDNIFDTSVLVQVVPNLLTSQNWLLDRFFPNVVTYETEEVAIDVDVGLRRMAPFVSPLVEGKVVESRKYQTNTFKPAYIKDLRAPDLRKPIRRMIGERIGGEYTAGEREMLNLQFEMADQIDMIHRRLEWMASSALVSGTVTVVGEGYETKVVNFGRASDLTITLSGSDKWPQSVAAGATNTQPSDDIEVADANSEELRCCANRPRFHEQVMACVPSGYHYQRQRHHLPEHEPYGNQINRRPD